MAAALLQHEARGSIGVHSAGSTPAADLNPVVVEAMSEIGIDLEAQPTRLTDSAVKLADVVITMGCGDACPIYAGKRYEDWKVTDPAGASLARVREIRDEIRARVSTLMEGL